MPFLLSRPSPVLAGALAAAGIMLAAAGCSHVTPLGPVPPQQRHLGSPLILQPMRSQPVTQAGECPPGAIAFTTPPHVGIAWRPTSSSPGGPATASPAGPASACYRKLGTPLSITSAAISPLSSFHPPSQPGGRPVPAEYGVMITLPAAGAAALASLTTKAFQSKDYLGISVAGKIWLVPAVTQPFTSPLQIFLASRNRALQLRRLLIPSS